MFKHQFVLGPKPVIDLSKSGPVGYISPNHENAKSVEFQSALHKALEKLHMAAIKRRMKDPTIGKKKRKA